VPLGRRRPALGLGRCGVAGHQPQALGPGGKPVASKHPVHAVWREHDPTPLLAPELRRDPIRPEPGVTEREGEHALLEERRSGWPSSAGAAPWAAGSPDRTGAPDASTGRRSRGGSPWPCRRPARCRAPQRARVLAAGPVQGIILGQGGAFFPLDCQVKREDASPFPTGVGRRRVSLQLGDRTSEFAGWSCRAGRVSRLKQCGEELRLVADPCRQPGPAERCRRCSYQQ
jgi:hypothetical protein